MPEGTKFDNFKYKFQDKQVDLKRTLEAIRKEGKEVEDRFDAYLQEELFHGRAASRVEDFAEHELRPLLAEMRLRAVTQDRLNKYLHARHAEERNAHVAAINQELPDGGSGMKTADARAFLAGLDPAEKKRLEAVAAKVDAMLAKTRDAYVIYGLESQATVNGWAAMFQHYVPLMREDHDGGMGIGQGFSIKGSETKHITGSTAAVSDILANIALQREKAIVRGEKNRVAVALAGLAATNPNPDVWDFGPITERRVNPATGMVETMVKGNWRNADNVLTAKIIGKGGDVQERAIVFNDSDERAARMVAALKNLDAAQLEGLVGVTAKVTRYFASINTQYNPIFGVVNFTRDILGTQINLTSTPLNGKQAQVTGYALKFLAEAARAGFRMDNISDRALWEEFQREGGMTGFREMFRTSADRAEAIRAELDPQHWQKTKIGKVVTAGGLLNAPMAMGKNTGAWLLDQLSNYNEALESVTRLAAYKVALDQGLSKQRAASIAKNITVNFNRKGQQGTQLGAFYAFFNASMQGSARLAEVLFTMEGGNVKTLRLTGKGASILAGGVTLGVLQAVALAAAGFDDDEPPQFVRERNIIIPIGDKKYVTIPMPLGLHVLPNFGRIATELVLRGGKAPGKAATQFFGLMAEAFNPIGNAGMSWQTAAPTVADPAVALLENRDFTGRPIAKQTFDKAQPGFKNAKDVATAHGKWIAEAINRMSGGTQYTRGTISPTPDQIDYLIGQVTGGVGREASKAMQSISAVRTGEDLPPHKVPLLGRFYGDAAATSAEGSRFYTNLERMREHKAMIDGLTKDQTLTAERRSEAVKRYIADNPDAGLFKTAEKVADTVSALRKHKRTLLERNEPRAKVKEIEAQITAAERQFNEAVKKAQAPSGPKAAQPMPPSSASQAATISN